MRLLLVNSAGVLLLHGGVGLAHKVRRRQARRFKHDARFSTEHPSDGVRFGSQDLDNAIRAFALSRPTWTPCEVAMPWAVASGVGTWLSWRDHRPWLSILTLLAPAVHEMHFVVVHRLMH